MVFEPIEFMDGIYELNKFINPCGDDRSRQVKQAFNLAHKTINTHFNKNGNILLQEQPHN